MKQHVRSHGLIISRFEDYWYCSNLWGTTYRCSGVKVLASWPISAHGTANGGLWTESVGWFCGPALCARGCCCCGTCSGRAPGFRLATLVRGGGVCSLWGLAPAALVDPHGDTGVEGGVEGLKPEVDCLSQALRSKWKRQLERDCYYSFFKYL